MNVAKRNDSEQSHGLNNGLAQQTTTNFKRSRHSRLSNNRASIRNVDFNHFRCSIFRGQTTPDTHYVRARDLNTAVCE